MPCYFFYELNITCTFPKLTNTQKNWQLCLCLKGTKGGSFGSNARLLSLGIIFTGCCCRWRNIHLSSAKNFSNNPVLMSAQGPGRIQPNLNRNNPAIIKKSFLKRKLISCKYKGSSITKLIYRIIIQRNISPIKQMNRMVKRNLRCNATS